MDPSGTFYEWKATSIGKNSELVKQFLEKRYKDNMSEEDSIILGL